jgi:hypothetical protein
MAEIKSTLELAMERTKRISISGEDREEIKRKEILQKASGLFHRYREGHLPLHEILKEMEKMEEKTRTLVKASLVSQLIEAVSLASPDDENTRIFEAIESLKDRDTDALRQRLDQLLARYRKEREKTREKVRTQLLEALRKEGLSGSAVEPNVEGDPLWEKELEKLGPSYHEELKAIQQKLAGL